MEISCPDWLDVDEELWLNFPPDVTHFLNTLQLCDSRRNDVRRVLRRFEDEDEPLVDCLVKKLRSVVKFEKVLCTFSEFFCIFIVKQMGQRRRFIGDGHRFRVRADHRRARRAGGTSFG